MQAELSARNRQLDEAIWELKNVAKTGDPSNALNTLFFIGEIMKTREEANAMLVELAESFVGVTEVGGENRGPEVEAFQKAVDGKAQGEPWCMAFLMYCVQKTEQETQLMSAIFRSESVKQVWDFSPDDHKSKLPSVGSIMVWQYGTTGMGHAGLVTAIAGELVETIEGNTGAGPGVVREGDGVFKKTRPLADVGKMNFIGFLRVF